MDAPYFSVYTQTQGRETIGLKRQSLLARPRHRSETGSADSVLGPPALRPCFCA
jgi:hypothetical protein